MINDSTKSMLEKLDKEKKRSFHVIPNEVVVAPEPEPEPDAPTAELSNVLKNILGPSSKKYSPQDK